MTLEQGILYRNFTRLVPISTSGKPEDQKEAGKLRAL